MSPLPQIARLFKKSLYCRPHPLFIWDEGGSEENVWTAASLYWALVALDKEAMLKKEPAEEWPVRVLVSREELVTYEIFPKLIWELALAVPPSSVDLNALGGQRVVRLKNPVDQQALRGLPGLILNFDLLEVHFSVWETI